MATKIERQGRKTKWYIDKAIRGGARGKVKPVRPIPINRSAPWKASKAKKGRKRSKA